MRGKSFLVAAYIFVSASALASLPANRRTILTSGDTVYPVHYQLGQSTVLAFGFKPETVICGNKNYFNIERIKEGLTIQPLSNFSTNLTVINGDKRFLFYLTPAGRSQPDGFVDIKWVPPSEVTSLKRLDTTTQDVQPQSSSIALGHGAVFKVVDLLTSSAGGPSIVNFELRNESGAVVRTGDLQIAVATDRQPLKGQMTVWEQDSVSPHNAIKGRVIFGHQRESRLSLIVRFGQTTRKILLKGPRH